MGLNDSPAWDGQALGFCTEDPYSAAMTLRQQTAPVAPQPLGPLLWPPRFLTASLLWDSPAVSDSQSSCVPSLRAEGTRLCVRRPGAHLRCATCWLCDPWLVALSSAGLSFHVYKMGMVVSDFPTRLSEDWGNNGGETDGIGRALNKCLVHKAIRE